MGDKRWRSGILVGLAVAAGAFGAVAIMSAATAPTARADDFTDVINAVDGDYAFGQDAFALADTAFSSNDLGPGLVALFDGVNDDSVSVPDNLLVGTVEVLTNESVNGAIPWGFSLPADFSDAVTTVESQFAAGEGLLAAASSALSFGEYGTAAYDDLAGADLLTVAPLEELLLGAAVSF
jgi:hypothetical protein